MPCDAPPRRPRYADLADKGTDSCRCIVRAVRHVCPECGESGDRGGACPRDGTVIDMTSGNGMVEITFFSVDNAKLPGAGPDKTKFSVFVDETCP